MMRQIFIATAFMSVFFVKSQKLDYDRYTLSDVNGILEEKEALMQEFIQNPQNINHFQHFYYTSKNVSQVACKNAEKDFDLFLTNLKKDVLKIKKSNDAKVIELIYKAINTEYCQSMDLYSDFSDLFTSGRYNFQTAAALYMTALTKLEMPFNVSEKFTHTDVIAFPNSVEFHMIAPLTPNQAVINYLEVSTEFKNTYVTKLKDNKLLLAEDERNKTNTELFNTYFYKEKVDNINQYIGILHYIESIKTSTPSDFQSNLNNAIIGNIYYPCFRGNMLIYTHVSTNFSTHKIESLMDIKQLELISRIPYISEENSIFNTYDYFTDKVLLEKSNLKVFDTCSKYLLSKSVNQGFRKHVEETYYAEMGRFYVLKNEYNQAIPYLLVAHNSNPENVKLTNMLVESIYEKLKVSDGEDTSGIMSYVDKDSFLLNDSKFRALFGFFLSEYISNGFLTGKINQCDKHLLVLEKLLKMDPVLPTSDTGFREVYVNAAKYYQRLNNTKKAREYLKRGLVFYPKDVQMLRMYSY